MDLASALTTEGPLQKQSPGFFKVYQSRYFAIRGKGELLVWFKKKPVSPDQNPQGVLQINTIKQVKSVEGEELVFSIIYIERTFNLRAESATIKQRWINSLNTIISHQKKIRKNAQVKTAVGKEPQSWKWKSMANQEISEKIRIQNQQALLQDQGNNKRGFNNEEILAKFLKEKNMQDYQKCIVFGFFTKKKLLGNQYRWYFLASCVNLKDEKDQELYPAVEQFIISLNEPQKPKKQPLSPSRKKYDSSSSDQQAKMKKVQIVEDLSLRMNTLFEYDPQQKQIKHSYNLVDIVSYQMKTDKTFQLKIVYEQVINLQQEQIKQNQIVFVSDYLVEVKKFHKALKIIQEKYNMQKQRQFKNANKSKRYSVKKWKYVNQDQWRIAQEKSNLYVLLNKKCFKLNMLQVNLEQIHSHHKESVSVQTVQVTKQEDQKTIKKKEDALLVVFKQEKEEFKIYIQFDKTETLVKFNKKLGKNIKKMKQELEALNVKTSSKKQQQKKINPDTYLLDKKIRESTMSIKVNFYQRMQREVIVQKLQDNGKQNKSFWDKFMGMFCASDQTNFFN